MKFTRDSRYRLYIRLDGNGNPIAGTSEYRLTPPKTRSNGNWVDITACAFSCCQAPAYVMFTNANTHSDNITAITSSDGRFSWTGSLAVGQSILVQLNFLTPVTFTVTTTNSTYTLTGGDAYTSSANGTITACVLPTAGSSAIVVTPQAGDQFLVTLTNSTSC